MGMKEGCRICLSLRIDTKGGFEDDTAHWQLIAIDGRKVLDRCLGALRDKGRPPSGGGGYSGRL